MGVELSVDIRTDFVPRAEYTEVLVSLDGQPPLRVPARGPASLDPRRVADFEGLAPSSAREMRVALLDSSGRELVARDAVLVHQRDLAVTLTFSRDCRGVMCPRFEGDANISCLAGRCVNPDCVTGSEPTCPEANCMGDTDCDALSACAAARCQAGVCLYEPLDDICSADEFCDPERGCRALPVETDTGARDTGARDTGVDAGPDTSPEDTGMDTEPTPECSDGETRSCTTICGSSGTQRCMFAEFEPCEAPSEDCSNERDDDCDGRVDESTTCPVGTTEPCTTTCDTTGERTCESCGWGACVPPGESCNGNDDNCDGEADEIFECAFGTTEPCTTSCGSTGERLCTPSCTWLSVCIPPDEVMCNERDDDCDGGVDEGTRVTLDSVGYSTDLARRQPACDGVGERYGADCNAAFHRHCTFETCSNTGLGPAENSGDSATAVCVQGVLVTRVPWDELRAIQPGCASVADSASEACRSAVHRFCAARDEISGFGPVEIRPADADLVCVPWADVLSTTYSAMRALIPGCDGSVGNRSGLACNAAIHRFCRSRGAESGFGPLENSGDNLQVACLSR